MTEEDFAAERAAVERLEEALGTIQEDLGWYWHWGDGCGGYLLERIAEVVRGEGYRWPLDPPTDVPRPKAKALISRSLARRVMERDAYRCVTCQTHIDLTCDHIIPESKGGETTFENLQTMCRPCNSRKGNRMPEGQ